MSHLSHNATLTLENTACSGAKLLYAEYLAGLLFLSGAGGWYGHLDCQGCGHCFFLVEHDLSGKIWTKSPAGTTDSVFSRCAENIRIQSSKQKLTYSRESMANQRNSWASCCILALNSPDAFARMKLNGYVASHAGDTYELLDLLLYTFVVHH